MKIATSFLATMALAQPQPESEIAIAAEITDLENGCDSLMKSSAFNDKQPKLTNAEWQAKWLKRCSRKRHRLEKSYDRCGFYVADYKVALTKNVETETCDAISEFVAENIRWIDNHIVDTECAERVKKMTKRMEIWEGKLRSLIDCPAVSAPEPVSDGYTVPADFAGNDYFDDYFDPNDEYADYYPDYFDAGDVITLSKRCTNDFDFSKAMGLGNPRYRCLMPEDDWPIGEQIAWDTRVRKECGKDASYVLAMAMKDPSNTDEYLTWLNCPQCGCTLGEDDAVDIESDRSHFN